MLEVVNIEKVTVIKRYFKAYLLVLKKDKSKRW